MSSTTAAAATSSSDFYPNLLPVHVPIAQFTPTFLENYVRENQLCLEGKNLSPYFETHATENKKMMLAGAKDLQGTAIILGLGNGSDTPLEELASQFDKVIAVDMDLEAMRVAISKLPSNLQAKVELRQEDITGIGKNFSSSLERFLEQKPSFMEFKQKIFRLMQEANPSRVALPQGSYIVSDLIATQLASQLCRYILTVAEKAFPRQCEEMKRDVEFSQAITELSKKVQNAHLEDLSSWLQDGRIYLVDTVYLQEVLWQGDLYKLNEPKFLISYSFFEKQVELFHKVAERDWEWRLKRPENGRGESYAVLGRVFTKKPCV